MNKIDILNREDFVKQTIQLINNISDNKATTTFALNGEWGCGKSFVLDMLEEQLDIIQSEENAGNKFFVVRYNCWKYDYYEEPLISIVASLIETINNKANLLDNKQREEIKGVLKAVGTALLSIGSNALKSTTGIDLKPVFEIVKDGIESGSEKYKEMNAFDAYFEFNQTLIRLQKTISKISNEYTVVFMVDELDRCLPEYAIKVLERLHHLSEDVSNIITIISIDKSQLTASINRIFGFDDVDKYLKKFIHFTVKLDLGDVSDKIRNKYLDYISLFDSSINPISDSIEEFMQEIFKGIDIREQERIIHKAMMCHKLLFDEPKDYRFMCVELLITVMNTCYQNLKTFTPWIQKYASSQEANKKTPPFSGYFEERFKTLDYKEICTVGYEPRTILSFTDTTSLYNSILCIWCNIFFSEKKKGIGIKIEDEQINDAIKKTVIDLRDFYDTINLIK